MEMEYDANINRDDRFLHTQAAATLYSALSQDRVRRQAAARAAARKAGRLQEGGRVQNSRNRSKVGHLARSVRAGSCKVFERRSVRVRRRLQSKHGPSSRPDHSIHTPMGVRGEKYPSGSAKLIGEKDCCTIK